MDAAVLMITINLITVILTSILLGGVLYMKKKIDEYDDKIKYLESTCSQASKISTETANELEEIKRACMIDKVKAFWQGIAVQKKRKG